MTEFFTGAADALAATVFLGGATFFTVFLTTAFLAEAWGVEFFEVRFTFVVTAAPGFFAGAAFFAGTAFFAEAVATTFLGAAFFATAFFVDALAVDGMYVSLDSVNQRADPSSQAPS